jgi:hypothetical protein
MERIGSLPSVTSSTANARSLSQTTISPRSSQSVATDAAIAITGQFRKNDADDPEVFAAAYVRILQGFPDDVVRAVADPLTGIARERSSPFLPAPSELLACLDGRMAPILAAEKREREREEVRRYLERPVDVATPEERARAVKRWFDEIRPQLATIEEHGQPKPRTALEVLGCTQEQWDAIPNRPRP